MKKGLITIGVIVLIGLILYSFFAGRYNTMVELQEISPRNGLRLKVNISGEQI